MSYYRGNWALTYKNHKALKIVEIVIHYLSILCFSPGLVFFLLKYFLKSRTFTKNLFVNFYVIFTFFPFFALSHWQNLGHRVEEREGGVREAEKSEGRKS